MQWSFDVGDEFAQLCQKVQFLERQQNRKKSLVILSVRRLRNMEAAPDSVLHEQQPTKPKEEGSREEEEEEEEQVANELRAKWDAPPPQISDEDLATALRVVRALAGTREIKRARYMNLRIACGRIVKVVKKRYHLIYTASIKSANQLLCSSKERKADRKVKKRKQLEEDKHLRQKTALRTKRLEKKQRTKYMVSIPVS